MAVCCQQAIALRPKFRACVRIFGSKAGAKHQLLLCFEGQLRSAYVFYLEVKIYLNKVCD
jgi:hypothetical protein